MGIGNLHKLNFFMILSREMGEMPGVLEAITILKSFFFPPSKLLDLHKIKLFNFLWFATHSNAREEKFFHSLEMNSKCSNLACDKFSVS